MSINSLGIKIVLVSILCGLTSCSTTKTSCTVFECFDPTVIEKPTSTRHFIPTTYSQYVMPPPALADSESDARRIEKQRIVIIKVRDESFYFDRQRGKLLKSSSYYIGERFGEGLARVTGKNEKEGFINERGEWAISPRFAPSKFERRDGDVNANDSTDNRQVFHEGAAPVKVGKKYRFINKQGKFFTSSFDSVRAFDRGVAVVSVDRKYGLINKQGKFIISPRFDKEPSIYHDRGGMLVVQQDGRQQCIDNRGLPAPEHTCQDTLAEKENQKQAEQAERAEQAKEKSREPESAFKVENGAVYLNGKLLLDRWWDRVSIGCGGVYMYRVGDKWGVVHQSGEIKTPPQFDRIDEFLLNRGLMNSTYDCPFKNGLARVSVNGKMGFVDEMGKFAIPPKFEFVDNFGEDPNRTFARLGSKKGLIDRQGNFISPAVLFGLRDSFDGRFSSVAVVKRKGKFGFIDRQGKLVVPAQYDEIAINDPGQFRGVLGYYDSLGRDKLIQVRIGKKWGYVNTSGIIQIPAKFDEAGFFKYGVAEVKVGARTFYIDRQSKILPF